MTAMRAWPKRRDAVSHGAMQDDRPSLARLAWRGLAAGSLTGLAAALGFGSMAGAQEIGGFDSRAPVNYAADLLELQDRQDRVVLAGNVVITQGDLRLTAGRTTIAYSDAGTLRIQRIDATGGVTVTRGQERASGSAAVYDFNRRVIVLSGGVALRRGSDTLDGGRLVYDLDSGVASVEGGGGDARGSGGSGRVTGTFAVPER